MRLLAGVIILSNGVPGLMNAWRLSQAVIMTNHFSHEIDASRLRLTAKVRFGNPTDYDLNVSRPIIKFFYNQKLLFTSSETDQNFKLIMGNEICFDPISTQILKQSYPDLFNEYTAKARLPATQEKVNITAEIKTMINKKIPCIRNMIVRI